MAKMAIADQVLQRQDKDGMLRRALERIIQLYTDKSLRKESKVVQTKKQY